MKVFVLPRLLAATFATFFSSLPADRRTPDQPSFWILHAR